MGITDILQKSLYSVVIKLAGGNFLDNIEWFWEKVTAENFAKKQVELPVGKLGWIPFDRKKDDTNPLVWLRAVTFAKIRGWREKFEGHPEITERYFRAIPLVLAYPNHVIEDVSKQRYLFVGKLEKNFSLVVEIGKADEKNYLVTAFMTRKRYLKRREPYCLKHKKMGMPAGTALSPILAPTLRLGGGSRFSTLQDTRMFYTKLEKQSQGKFGLNYALIDSSEIHLEHPAVEAHGDYSSNVALAAFEQFRVPRPRHGEAEGGQNSEFRIKNPRELAGKIVEALSSNKELKKAVSRIEVAGPGFINFWLKPEILSDELKKIIRDSEKYGSSDRGKGKTFVIDYSSPNIAKRFTVGHLRSTIIGQAICNLYKFCGWKGIGDNHLGDWGTQFGKMIVAIRKWAEKSVDELTIDEMESLYVRFHQEAEKDETLEDEARQAFKNLEDEKKEERAMWKKLVDRSMEEFQKIYDILNVKIDVAHGESFYEDMMPAIVEEAKKKKVAIESKGALIISYPYDKLPPSMLIKSDGGTTYLTRDLATIKFRKQQWNPELVIYEVGAEQALYFKQVFWAAELLGWAKRDQFFHIPHGLIRLKEGKMSTRKGNVIKLEQVLAEAIDRAKKFNDDSEISKMVGIGAVKYNDLKHSPTTGYVFDWEEMITLDGNSGPYLQYTYARTKSVLAKAGIKKGVSLAGAKETPYQINQEELAILRWIYRFPEVVMEAAEQYAPNLVCTFLYELAQRFNTFYNKHSILKPQEVEGSDLSIKSDPSHFRLLLTAAVGQTLKNGLTLLGIQTPEKM